jgi:uncharacterized protein YndB with AHSA1/START domain
MTQNYDLTMERTYPAPTEVELTFAPEGDGTRLVLTQRGFPDAATRDDFAGGWSGVWDGLTPR